MNVANLSFAEVAAHLAPGHEQVERLIEEILALRRSEAAEHRALWLPFAALLAAHLDEEDARLIPVLYAVADRDARALVLEHKHLRTRIMELDRAHAAGTLEPAAIRLFVEEVLAHHRRERVLLARHADGT